MAYSYKYLLLLIHDNGVLMGKLTGYLWRQRLDVTAASPAVKTDIAKVVLDDDARLQSNFPTTAYGAETYISTSPYASAIVNSPMFCDLSSTIAGLPSGYSITGATLYAYYYAYPFTNPVGNQPKAALSVCWPTVSGSHESKKRLV